MAEFIDNYDNAKNSYKQSDLQINHARNLLGNMGNQVADLFYPKAQETYGKVITTLNYAQISADKGYDYTNQMKPQANSADRQLIVSQLDQTYYDLSAQINEVRNNATTLGYEASQGQFKNRTVTSVEDLPDESAGVIVQREQTADAESSRVQNPTAEATELVDGKVATVSDAGNDSNADKTKLANNAELEETPNGVTSEVGTRKVPATSSQAGVCAASDDWKPQPQTSVGSTTAVGGRPAIPPQFLAPIKPTPNKLANLASQTYSISLYLLNKDEYKEMIQSQNKFLGNKSIIMQSGGINGNSFIGKRNKYFDVDFFIDEVEVHSQIHSQASTAPHNVLTLKMTIVEPNGITLLNRLDAAVREHAKIANAPVNSQSQNYLMVIRFYGYDANGKMLTGKDLGISEVGSDPNAFVEKWIPFNINNITYQISSKGVEYRVQATVPQVQVNFSQSLGGSIPFNIELTAPDLKTLFNGPVAYSTTQQSNPDTQTTATGTAPAATTATAATAAGGTSASASAPAKAGAITPTTITQGLAEALNQFQKDLVKKGTQEIADEYEIILYNQPGLIDAKLAKPGSQDKTRSPMKQTDNPSQKLLSSKSSYDKETKNYNITAGTQITQVIDLALRSSSYVTSQQNISYDEKTQQSTPQPPVQTVQWYRIQGKASPIGYDRKRRNYAYKITYTITPYQINDPRSPYFDRAAYRGVHKVYNYWFTGQNTEVLDFTIDVNNNYLTVVGVDIVPATSASGRWFEKRAFQTRPNESSQGGTGTSTMPAASLAERLYSFADVSTADVQILGDPDWLQQTEVFYLDTNLNPFAKDGSVNTAASEVLFEMRFNSPTDFNLSTGLTPVYKGNTAQSPITGETNLPSESIVYNATTVTSNFKQGKFTQRLKGTVREFRERNYNNQSAPTNTGTTSTTPTASTSRTPVTQRQPYEPFDYDTYAAQADTFDDAGGAEAVNSQRGLVANQGSVETTSATDTGTTLAQNGATVNEDANKDEVSASAPLATTNGKAPDDDAGYDP